VEKVVAVVGARLNSSRMPRKQLLDLAGRPLISHVFQRLEAAQEINQVVLATTDDAFNYDLVDWARREGKTCLAFQGDVNDLMGRVDVAVKQYEADILVYVCGDSPLVEPATLDALVRALKLDEGAEFACLEEPPGGKRYIHEGFAVYRRRFWDRMVAGSTEPFEKEHVGSVFHSLAKVLPQREAIAKEDPVFYSVEHRLSVDTPADYAFMNEIYSRWRRQHGSDTLVDLKWVISTLASDRELRAMNEHVRQKTVTEKNAGVAILTQTGPDVGLGHLRRMARAGELLVENLSVSLNLVILGAELSFDWLRTLPHRWLDEDELRASNVFGNARPDLVLVDLPAMTPEVLQVLKALKLGGTRLVSVDKVWQEDLFDAFYIPCFQVAGDVLDHYGERVHFGWSHYFFQPVKAALSERPSHKRLAVLTGASDAYGLGKVWPSLLDKAIAQAIEIVWVQGPHAPPPVVAELSGAHRITVHKAPGDVMATIASCDAALVAYGVSYFECLHAGLSAVAYVPAGKGLEAEADVLDATGDFMLARTPEKAVTQTALLLASEGHEKRAKALSEKLWPQKARHPVSDLVVQLLPEYFSAAGLKASVD